MYSVKPGRGPSLLGTIVAAAMAAFGVIFLVGSNAAMSHMESATGMSGPPAAFRLIWNAAGVLFIVVALAMAVYNFVNFKSRNRMSAVDITTGQEESDPIADMLGYGTSGAPAPPTDARETDGADKPRRFEGDGRDRQAAALRGAALPLLRRRSA